MMPPNIVTATRPIISSVVAAFLLLGLRKAGTPLLIASTPVSAAQPEEKARRIRKAQREGVRSLCSATISIVGGGRVQLVAQDEQPEAAPEDHADHRDHEGVGRDGEGRAGLAEAAQVDHCQQDDDDDRDQRLVLGDEAGSWRRRSRRRWPPTPRR